MKIQKLLGIECAFILAAALTGCGESTLEETKSTAAEEGIDKDSSASENLNEDGSLVINKADITEEASFFNYDADEVTVQVLVIASADGTVHAAYNTCQTCSPSPMAYFVQEGENLICQNCGNSFTAEDVGSSAAGCNPMQIENLTETEDELIIPAADLESVRDRFEKWQGIK